MWVSDLGWSLLSWYCNVVSQKIKQQTHSHSLRSASVLVVWYRSALLSLRLMKDLWWSWADRQDGVILDEALFNKVSPTGGEVTVRRREGGGGRWREVEGGRPAAGRRSSRSDERLDLKAAEETSRESAEELRLFPFSLSCCEWRQREHQLLSTVYIFSHEVFIFFITFYYEKKKKGLHIGGRIQNITSFV